MYLSKADSKARLLSVIIILALIAQYWFTGCVWATLVPTPYQWQISINKIAETENNREKLFSFKKQPDLFIALYI